MVVLIFSWSSKTVFFYIITLVTAVFVRGEMMCLFYFTCWEWWEKIYESSICSSCGNEKNPVAFSQGYVFFLISICYDLFNFLSHIKGQLSFHPWQFSAKHFRSTHRSYCIWLWMSFSFGKWKLMCPWHSRGLFTLWRNECYLFVTLMYFLFIASWHMKAPEVMWEQKKIKMFLKNRLKPFKNQCSKSTRLKKEKTISENQLWNYFYMPRAYKITHPFS